NFWIPFYTIFLQINPKVAFWLSLVTMLFGFGSGVIRNLYKKTINWYLVSRYLLAAIPFSFLGSYLSNKVSQKELLLTFAIFIICYGSYMIYHSRKEPKEQEQHEKIYWLVGIIGGFLKGLIATGLGKLLLPAYINHKRIKHHSEAVGTTVMVVFLVNVISILGRMCESLIQEINTNKFLLISMLIWVIPAVVIGGQFGPIIAEKLPKKYIKPYIGIILIFAGSLILMRGKMQ
ncbi:MAG: sulfite exporter TauE/SafE family protein, partial [Spirochaetota bacterium]